jgi:hypothetical protein
MKVQRKTTHIFEAIPMEWQCLMTSISFYRIVAASSSGKDVVLFLLTISLNRSLPEHISITKYGHVIVFISLMEDNYNRVT